MDAGDEFVTLRVSERAAAKLAEAALARGMSAEQLLGRMLEGAEFEQLMRRLAYLAAERS